jgi:outer membrane protein assembly factor BamB
MVDGIAIRTNKVAGFMCLAGLLSLGPANANDWIQWRGPNENGFVELSDLPDSWEPGGRNVLWRAPYGTRSAPLVHGGRVFMINRAGSGVSQQERIMALDLDTGKVVWEHRFNVFLTDIVAHRLGWSNLAIDPETGTVYGHGVQGLFFCISHDGRIIWQRSLTEEFGRISGYGGRTNSPVVDGDLVIINFLSSGWGPHGPGLHRFMAMDKLTGAVIWWSEPSGKPLDTTYSVPVVAEINGQRLLIAGLADGAVHAIKISTGEPVWKFKLSKRGINSSVIVDGSRVYACHGEENLDSTQMGRVVCIDGSRTGDITESGEIWRYDDAEISYTSPLLAKGKLYVCDNAANIHCLDAASGKKEWQFNYGNAGKGSAVYADGKIYIGEVGGQWHILEPGATGCKLLDSDTFRKQDGSPDEIYGSPAVVDGRVILPTNTEVYCIGKKVEPVPGKARVVKTRSGTGPVTHLQIVPAESWIEPGAKQNFSVHAFNAKGERVTAPAVTWSTKGLQGTFADSVFIADGESRMRAGMIAAQAGQLEAHSRLRVIPPLDLSFDFEDTPVGVSPAGWITSKMKAHVVEFDGSKVLKKMADRPAPPFARLRCYITPPLKTGYSVQTDLMGMAKKKRFLPDMGLLNSRYKMILLGSSEMTRVLRLVTWDPMPRLQKDIDFDWKPDTWYIMKLSVHIESGRAIVRGKVWPRGTEEPEKWTIEMEDPYPNEAGSPGLYAYSVAITSKSAGTSVYFDNVSIKANE